MKKFVTKLLLMSFAFAFLLLAKNTPVLAVENSTELSTSVISNAPAAIYFEGISVYSSANDIQPTIYVTYLYQGVKYGGTLSLQTVTTGGGTYTGHYAGYLYPII
jgi:hypothetical protein